ncbi:hypothetical protein [Crocosphaera sp. XPORK-15E]|uniref:hypothetical protein n=1 Tax=Crocosphaera sp. XPORK-15E TaxID=3110247 RepID=UPI002B20F565|nr:hypothetical protein [Crocosphaera sp. XPORK-15E]MEA5535197.1 hypothetical protein [Crocosphaera sp. XPORK-15E]
MNLQQLLETATDKQNFMKIRDYFDFSLRYLEFIKNNLQAVIVSQNETHYRFFQYKEDGTYNITRPINSNLMLYFEYFEQQQAHFLRLLKNITNQQFNTIENRQLLNNFIYTTQQSIGATLDALPAKRSNIARKINGDLFERLIKLVILEVGIDVMEGTTSIPVKIEGEEVFKMKYQHDLMIKKDEKIRAIGSVKTSSKDRLDKIFVDKFLYNRLTDTDTPHFAIFLNDVQRKGKEGRYGINSTFLSGHFKGYTIKLNSLDGVYYFDIRPNMQTDNLLKDYIKTFDDFLFTEIWQFTN